MKRGCQPYQEGKNFGKTEPWDRYQDLFKNGVVWKGRVNEWIHKLLANELLRLLNGFSRHFEDSLPPLCPSCHPRANREQLWHPRCLPEWENSQDRQGWCLYAPCRLSISEEMKPGADQHTAPVCADSWPYYLVCHQTFQDTIVSPWKEIIETDSVSINGTNIGIWESFSKSLRVYLCV